MSREEFFSEFGHLALAPDGVARLRRLILDLAVRGRLVPQDPSDEPASVLLERIAEERERLVAEKKIRVSKTQRTSDSYEAEFVVPASWATAQLGEVARVVRGVTFPASAKSKQPKEGRIACLRSGNVQREIEYSELIYIPEEVVKNADQYLIPHDLVISIANSRELVGKTAVASSDLPFPSVIGGFLAAIRPIAPLSHRYFGLVLSSSNARRFWLENASQTTNIANISSSLISSLPIGLPPLPEQGRIVAKVDELMAVCDELEQEQAKAKTLRAQTAQSSLRRVVESGREETPEAIELLQQSLGLTLRPGDGAAEALAKTREAILDLAVRGRLSGNIGGSQIALGDLAEIRGGQQPKVKVDKYWGGEEPFLMGGDFSEDSFRIRAGSRTLTAEGVKASGSPLVPADSVVMMTVGATIGKVCLLDIPMHISPNLTGIALADDRLDPDFLYWQLRAIRDRLVQIGGGSAQPFISKTALSEVEMFVPSVEDQRSIVDRIDDLMAVCDELEESLATERQLATDFAESAVHALVS